MAKKDDNLSAHEIIEALNKKNVVVSDKVKKELEFAKVATEIVDSHNQNCKKKKLIYGISLAAVLILLLILALFLPNAGQTSKLFFN